MRRSDTTWTPAALAALVAMAVLACGEEAPPPESAPRPVKIFTVGGEGASRTLEYPGEVQAVQHAEMSFEVQGRIIEFPVDEGQVVEQGQVLAKLDPRDYEADLSARRAQVEQARTEYQRQQTLLEKDVAPRQDVERARRNLEVTRAGLQTAQKAVEDTELRAPFAGVVARKLVRDFRNVRAKEPVLILEDDSGLQVQVNVPERDWVYARGRGERSPEGSDRLNPRVHVSNYPDRSFPAELREVATAADPTTRTYAVTLSFDVPGDVNVLPGMTAKVSLDVPGEVAGGALAIPARAVIDDGSGGPRVWRVDPEALTVTSVGVELGELSGDRIEVRDGLSPGDQIAVSGVHELREGAEVRRFGN